MKSRHAAIALTFVMLVCICGLKAQTPTLPTVPRLMNFSGTALDEQDKPIQGIAGVTFSIYREQNGGVPLWSEIQNVTPDSKGNFAVKLGATNAEGLPLDLFGSGEARWLGVRFNGGEERPRVMLLSVPYALKAADTETLGGLPASAFALAGTQAASQSTESKSSVAAVGVTITPALAGSGTTDFVPLWLDSAGNLGNSVLFQSGSGGTAKVGLNTTTPASTLDVNGPSVVRGLFTLPATGTATATAGKNSQPQRLTASSFSSSTSAAINQNYQWQAEPAGNNTTAPTGTLNLLFGSGTATPAETGLKISNKGVITFATGQTFPGTGAGSVKSVGLSAPASDFTVTGSPVTTTGTLGLAWTVAPTSAAAANAIAKRDANGGFNASWLSVTDPTGARSAIYGESGSLGTGVVGNNTSSGVGVGGSSISGVGVSGTSASYFGVSGGTNAGFAGVEGYSESSGSGVYGTSPSGYGVYGYSGTNAGIAGAGATGVYGYSPNGNALNGYTPGSSTTLLASNDGGGYAAWFNGSVEVDGQLSKASGSFKIDHPLDPANKYLYHSFVESPDMMNIYNGNVMTDAQGKAVVELPEWFEALNQDFRYQLTVVGQFAQAIVAGKISNHRFIVRTDKPNVEVSWQVTGVRHDAWANAHRIPVEEMKKDQERGSYLHPELFGESPEKSVMAARHPDAAKRWKQSREGKPVAAQPAPR